MTDTLINAFLSTGIFITTLLLFKWLWDFGWWKWDVFIASKTHISHPKKEDPEELDEPEDNFSVQPNSRKTKRRNSVRSRY